MNKKNMFNQKLEQVGGENVTEGIILKGEDKEKILNFINANTKQNYILNDNKLEKIYINWRQSFSNIGLLKFAVRY